MQLIPSPTAHASTDMTEFMEKDAICRLTRDAIVEKLTVQGRRTIFASAELAREAGAQREPAPPSHGSRVPCHAPAPAHGICART